MVGQNLHQSWGLLTMAVGVIFGCILGVIFRINFFVSPVWIIFVVLIFIIMYIKPRYFTVGMCLIAGMVLAFFRVAVVLTEVENENMDAEPVSVAVAARDWFAERIEAEIPEPEVKLSLSYLLGIKDDLPKDLKNNLKKVGLTHIVVASGAHLSILVEIVRKIFGRVSRFSGLLFSIIFILFFMAMVGWTPSILRAGAMTMMTLLAWYTGRKIAPLRLIIIVAAFTLVLNPMFLTNLGWLLSFASYAGIMLIGPVLTKFFYGERKPKFVASMIITTLAATLMTLPISLYYFGQVSIILILANLLILPTLSYAMGLTFLTGIFHGVPFISMAVSFLTTKLIDFHIFIIEKLAEMEQFLITIDTYNPWVFLIYAPIVVVAVFILIRKLRRSNS